MTSVPALSMHDAFSHIISLHKHHFSDQHDSSLHEHWFFDRTPWSVSQGCETGLPCRYEIRDISPPSGVRAAMELQVNCFCPPLHRLAFTTNCQAEGSHPHAE